jgi:hypothetical protein
MKSREEFAERAVDIVLLQAGFPDAQGHLKEAFMPEHWNYRK